MDFKHLEIFVSLVESKSFSQTAVDLGLSQPTISSSIKQLEEEIDAPLFIRSTREIHVTDLGEELYSDAKKLIEERERINMKLLSRYRSSLTLGTSTIPARKILPTYLSDFLAEHEDYRFSIFESNSLDIIEKVAKNELDVGFVGMANDNIHCDFHKIYDDQLVLITANTPYYQDLFKDKPKIDRLLQEPLILREKGSGNLESLDRLLKERGINKQSLAIRGFVNNLDLVINLASQGVAASVLSALSVEDNVKRGDILAYPLEDETRAFYLVWNSNIYQKSEVKAFIDFVKEHPMEV